MALVTTVKALPTLTHIGVSDKRVLGFNVQTLVSQGPVVELPLSAVASARTRPSYKQREFLLVVDVDGEEIDFGDVHGTDVPHVLRVIEQAAAAAENSAAVPSVQVPGPNPAPSHASPAVPAPEMSGWRFNPPPTWPPPPPDWTPPPGWRPDPSWPHPPPGWQLWVPVSPAEQQAAQPPAPVVPSRSSAPQPTPPTTSEYVGMNGRILLEGDALVLLHSGLNAKLLGHSQEPRRIPFSAVSEVKYTEPTRLTNGYLQLGLGGVAPPSLGVGNAASDPNTVIFTWRKRNEFHQLYSLLRHTVDANRASNIDPSTVPYDAAPSTRPAKPHRTGHEPTAGPGPRMEPDRSAREGRHGTWPVVDPPRTTPSRLPELVSSPAWLPGDVEIEVVGEVHHEHEMRLASGEPADDGVRTAVLVPEPRFSEYPDAVAVFVQTYHVGFISKEICGRVHRAIIDFADSHEGRLPSCPAEFYENIAGMQVVLLIDPRPLGLPPSLFSRVPDIAKAVDKLLGRLDGPPPVLQGRHVAARQALASAEADYAQAMDTWSGDRPRNTWPDLERRINPLIRKLERAADPKVADAWLLYARSVRFQKGRRDDTLNGYFNCLRFDRSNGEAWSELFEYVCSAPHVPMLLDLYRRVPIPLRAGPARYLLAVSHGSDRHGNMSAHRGERLRTELKALATSQDDGVTVAVLAEDAGRHAEKDGDQEAAIAAYREAVAAGSTDSRVADRLSIWLVKRGLYAEAEKVIVQALQEPPKAATTRDRLEKRLRRCRRQLSEDD
ncbi:DUF4429 domain-containing protein [Actinomadura sp.]|uniref:DUF4429 domain-containing protein n=1 Tax=Actinomadura sp. TaxID=1989 RepID=UPI0037C50C19